MQHQQATRRVDEQLQALLSWVLELQSEAVRRAHETYAWERAKNTTAHVNLDLDFQHTTVIKLQNCDDWVDLVNFDGMPLLFHALGIDDARTRNSHLECLVRLGATIVGTRTGHHLEGAVDLAVQRGDMTDVELLLSFGIPVGGADQIIHYGNAKGRSPLRKKSSQRLGGWVKWRCTPAIMQRLLEESLECSTSVGLRL